MAHTIDDKPTIVGTKAQPDSYSSQDTPTAEVSYQEERDHMRDVAKQALAEIEKLERGGE